MVDKTNRELAKKLLLQFMAGEITNDEFEDGYPLKSHDGALDAIAQVMWGFYDDRHEHKLTGLYALDELDRRVFQRCVLFLSTDLEYGWENLVPGPGLFVQVFTMDVGGRRYMAKVRQHGDYEVWPFRYRADLNDVQEGASESLAEHHEDASKPLAAVYWWIQAIGMGCYLAFFIAALSLIGHYRQTAFFVFTIAAVGLAATWVSSRLIRRLAARQPASGSE